MSDLNQVTITGRLGADPELKRTQQGSAVANLRVAVSETWKDRNTGERKERTEWIPVVIWNEGLCKVVENYVKKGSRILIQGKWATRKWTDQAGADRYSTELVLQGPDARLIMLDSASSSGSSRSSNAKPQQPDDRNSYGDQYDDSDPPF